jgi:hypothetical protein
MQAQTHDKALANPHARTHARKYGTIIAFQRQQLFREIVSIFPHKLFSVLSFVVCYWMCSSYVFCALSVIGHVAAVLRRRYSVCQIKGEEGRACST